MKMRCHNCSYTEWRGVELEKVPTSCCPECGQGRMVVEPEIEDGPEWKREENVYGWSPYG